MSPSSSWSITRFMPLTIFLGDGAGAAGAPKLVAGDDVGFLNAVALRTVGQRPSSGTKAPLKKGTPHQARAAARRPGEAAKKAEAALKGADPGNPLARLLARFSRD